MKPGGLGNKIKSSQVKDAAVQKKEVKKRKKPMVTPPKEQKGDSKPVIAPVSGKDREPNVKVGA